MKRLLSEIFDLKLNERLKKLWCSRIEYGFKDSVLVDFEIVNRDGGCKLVTEDDFVKWKGQRTIGVFGVGPLSHVVGAAESLYPDATIIMRCDPNPKKRRRTKH